MRFYIYLMRDCKVSLVVLILSYMDESFCKSGYVYTGKHKDENIWLLYCSMSEGGTPIVFDMAVDLW
jgi:hypothetical protein